MIPNYRFAIVSIVVNSIVNANDKGRAWLPGAI